MATSREEMKREISLLEKSCMQDYQYIGREKEEDQHKDGRTV